MILAIILRDRSGSSCLNGRRRTRDWSGRRIVDVRWTRIEEAVIMDWLIWRNEPGSPQLFSTRTFFRVLPGTPRSRSVASNRLEESNGENEYRLARPCGCGVYVLVPISHAATPTNRGAYCLFLNVGN